MGFETGQMTKLLVVADSLRNPVAFGRTPVFKVGMLSWQTEPAHKLSPVAVAAVAFVATSADAMARQAAPAERKEFITVISICRPRRRNAGA